MNNTVCKNFEYNEKAGGILELLSLNCEKCEFQGHCEIENAYKNAKIYSMTFDFNTHEYGNFLPELYKGKIK